MQTVSFNKTDQTVKTHRELPRNGVKPDVYGVLEIRGRRDLRSLFVSIFFPTYVKWKETKSLMNWNHTFYHDRIFGLSFSSSFKPWTSPFSAPDRMDMMPFRCFLSSGTDGSGLWLAENESLPAPVPKMVLPDRTGGAGGLSSGSPLSHIVERWTRAARGRAGSQTRSGSGLRWASKGGKTHIRRDVSVHMNRRRSTKRHLGRSLIIVRTENDY